jgi:glycosyltransferase involved in cell wall biosynthesis
MAFGIPVLVADSPGIRELVIPGVDAIVVEPTVTGIRDGLRIFINMSAAERRQLGRYSRESVLREYSVDRIACLERDLFRRLLENPNEFH